MLVLDLQTNNDLSKCLDCVNEDTQKNALLNEMCVVVWMEEEACSGTLGMFAKILEMINI